MPPSCAVLGGFAIGARIALLWQHNANAKCYRQIYNINVGSVQYRCMRPGPCLLLPFTSTFRCMFTDALLIGILQNTVRMWGPKFMGALFTQTV